MCGVEGVRRGRRRRGRAEEEEGGIQVHERRPLFMGRVGPRVGLHGSAVQRQRKASPKKARSTASRASRLLFLFSRWNIHRLAGLRVLLLPAHGSRSADAHEAWAGVGSILCRFVVPELNHRFRCETRREIRDRGKSKQLGRSDPTRGTVCLILSKQYTTRTHPQNNVIQPCLAVAPLD